MSKELVSLFERESVKHGLAIEEGDSKVANNAYEVIHKSYIAFKESNSLKELGVLLDHESPFVQLWTARYLLETCTEKSEKVLVELSMLKETSVSFDAKMTLLEWKEGNLKF